MSIDDDARQAAKDIKAERAKPNHAAKDDWHDHLRMTHNKKTYLGDLCNGEIALTYAPELAGLVRFNELSRRIELQRMPPWRTKNHAKEWGDDDDVGLAALMQSEGIPIHELAASRVAHLVAFKNSFHPVRDWLRSLPPWDNEPRIKEVLIEVLGANGDGNYLGPVLVAWMISAVARVMRPGCKADHMLVLVGDERIRKSSFAQVIGEPWTVETNSTFGTKDSVAELEGAWIIEVGELAALNRARSETVNQFLSKQIDHYRPAYGRAVIDQLRSCVFMGTVNDPKFLRSPFGNRRWWPVVCGWVDLELLRRVRLLLWAEAVARFDAGQQWHLTDEEEQIAADVQEDHRIVSEVEEDVRQYLALCLEREPTPLTETTVNDVFDAIAGEHERRTLGSRRLVEVAIGHAMRRCGWQWTGRKGKTRRTTYVYTGTG